MPRRKAMLGLGRALVALSLACGLVAGGAILYVRSGAATQLFRQTLADRLGQACGLSIELEELRVGALPPEVWVDRLAVRAPAGLALEAGAVHAELRLIPLLYGRLVFGDVTMRAPALMVDLPAGAGVDALLPCLAGSEERKPGEPERSTSKRALPLDVERLRLTSGRFALRQGDRALVASSLQLQLSRARGRSARVELEAPEVAVADGPALAEFALPLMRAHVDGRLLRPRAVELETMALSWRGARVRAQGRVDLLGPVYEGSVAVSALRPAEFLAAWRPWSEVLDVGRSVTAELSQQALGGVLSAEAQLQGGPDLRRAVVKLEGQKLRFAEYAAGDTMSALVKWRPGAVEIPSLEVQVGGGRVRGVAALSLTKPYELKATATPSGLSLGRTLAALGVPGSWVDLLASGRTSVRGQLAPFRISGPFDFAVKRLVVRDRSFEAPPLPDSDILKVPEVDVEGRWTFSPEGIRFDDVTVRRLDSVLRVGGELGFSTDAGIGFEVDAAPLDFTALGPVGGLVLRGAGRVKGRIGGAYEGPMVASGRLNVGNAAVGGLNLGEVRGKFRWDGDTRLDFRQVDGRVRESRYRGQAVVDLAPGVPLDLDIELSDGRWEDVIFAAGWSPELFGDARGGMSGQAQLSGPLERLSGRITGRGARLLSFGQSVDAWSAALRLDAGRIHIERFEAEAGGARIRADGWLDPGEETVMAQARTEGWTLRRLSHLDRAGWPIEGPIRAEAMVRGAWRAPEVQAAFEMPYLRINDQRFRGARLTLSVEDQKWSLRGRGFGQSVSVALSGGVARYAPMAGAISFRDWNAPGVWAAWRGEGALSGALSGRFEAAGPMGLWSALEGTLSVDRFSVGAEGMVLSAAPCTLSLAKGRVATEGVRLRGDGSRITAKGFWSERATDIDVEGFLSLALLRLWREQAQRAAGIFQFDARLSGPGRAPQVLGTGSVRGGLLQWRGFPSRLSGVSADVRFSRDVVVVERLEGRYAGGQLQASGQAGLTGLGRGALRMDVVVDDVQPVYDFGKISLRGRLSGRLRLRERGARVGVGGRLVVREGLIQPDFDIASLVGDRTRASALFDPAEEQVELSIDLVTDGTARLRNDAVDMELSGRLRLTGSEQRTGGLGSFKLIPGGRALLFGQRYVLESGSLAFRERYAFAPQYNLRLEARACDAQIRVLLSGSLEEVATNFGSSPEMDQEDIVSCLVSGVRIRDLDHSIPPSASSALLKLSGVDREVKKVLPLDEIDVTTEYASASRSYEPRVRLAKEVLAGRVRLEYSSSLIRTSDQQAALRWRLSPRLTLSAGWASSDNTPLGDIGLDLRQRWQW